jgi:hypothetical protein
MLKLKETKEGYLIHETNDKYIVCKIIKECDTKEEALKELIKNLNKKNK